MPIVATLWYSNKRARFVFLYHKKYQCDVEISGIALQKMLILCGYYSAEDENRSCFQKQSGGGKGRCNASFDLQGRWETAA
jgi:hypothetical protein